MKKPLSALRLLVLAFLLPITHIHAQDYASMIKDPGKDPAKHCKDPLLVLRAMPMEARFGTMIQDNMILLYFPDPAVYHALIRGSKDGFAIDLLHKDQFRCGANPIKRKGVQQGRLLQPLFKDDLQKRIIQTEQGYLIVNMGELPEDVSADEVEPNLILLHKRYTCHYLSIFNLDMQDWELLETGLYRDTLSSPDLNQSKTEALTKSLHFTIPFEKNRADYHQRDIKTLYDSLKLNDYDVTSIRILAYTSVEGSLEHNLKLQQRRAESLVKALEAYQGLPVKASIRTSENWVEFLEDISTTPYQHLTQLSKQEIKEKLKEQKLNAALEPYLQKHRKGLVELKLQKKVSYFQESAENLKRYYDQSIAEQNIEKALYLQEVIFERIQNESLPKDYLTKIEVPRHTQWGPLLLNRAVFEYSYQQQDELSALRSFEELQTLLPNNHKIAYNIVALKIKAWAHSPSLADPVELNKAIIDLRKKKIESPLVNRLLINFYIIQTQRQLFARNYREKDKNLQLIYNAYKGIKLSDTDALRLASFFAFYSRFDWSRAVLQSRVKKLDVHEDVVFYYLNLTMSEPRNTKNKDYRQILNNAFNANPLRYCQMFGTRGTGGVSFQLLQDIYLKQTFCDNCYDTASAD